MAQFTLRIIEEAHIGLRKKDQQDFHGHTFIPANPDKNLPPCCLVAVADGVSMGAEGALASKTAVENLLAEFARLYSSGQLEAGFALEKAFLKANIEVFKLARDRPGMATTLVSALIIGDQLITAHIGDSRIYLVRPNLNFESVTIDHSWVKEFGENLVRKGYLTDEELKKDGRRHSITRALGLQDSLLIDFTARTLQDGDLILTCTDGLWDMVGENKIEKILASGLPEAKTSNGQEKLNALCHNLVQAAIDVGGRDNITVSMTLVDRIGDHVVMPGLAKLLERTALDLSERTNSVEDLAEFSEEPTTLSTIPLKAKPYKPIGVVDLPVMEEKAPQYEAMLAQGQQSFALGQWEEGLNQLIELELLDPTHHGLYETLSSYLTRYIGSAIENSEPAKAERFYQSVLARGITRYDHYIFDYCLNESKRASSESNYHLSLTYADFAGKLQPQDNRIRQLQELNQLYLELKRADFTTSQKLSIAQNLYARDPDFGSIQDDLSSVYMQLGDDAARNSEDDDAIAWYELIVPLRPRDKRLVSLANSKLRSLEDKRIRQSAQSGLRFSSSVPIPHGLENLVIPNGPDGKPENEGMGRLKDRVSRAQKAWDNGRREVGAEYIYLVDQLSQLLSPNPWQPTFPRVCYDYGKWLLEQKQYLEAKPYFIKAQSLGMSAAQQRLSEIERLGKEINYGARGAPPVDLPDSVPPKPEKPLVSAIEAQYTQSNITGATQKVPVINPSASSEQASYTYFPPVPPSGYVAAAAASSEERSQKSERLVGVSGEPRAQNMADPLQSAAMRESRRSGSFVPPQPIASPSLSEPLGPNPYMEIVRNLWLPALLGLVIFVAVIFVAINIVSRLSKPTESSTQVASTQTTPAQGVTANATVVRSPRVMVTLEGAKPESLQMWLAAANEQRSNWRELSYTPLVGFQLNQADFSKLDPTIKYTLVITPRDTASSNFRKDLPLDTPIQLLFSKSNLAITSGAGLNVNFALPAEALNFYPLSGGTVDTTLADGSRFVAATRHTLRGEFLKLYDSSGGVGRFGYPISEEFDWEGIGHVQFLERGWLVQSTNDKLVKLGKLGSDVLGVQNCEAVPKPPTNVGASAPKVDTSFANYLKANPAIGQPLSPAFEVNEGNSKKKIQYFEFARLEVISGATDGAVTLGLLGSEMARCKNWYR
ncbi:protein phosphatase 2C domain-containing protein [Candidatus Chlorohelix sp.]|uniref:protein phosphatase 2C domain-containing protein n=1 Tax=Candidatus Chlorohelix sp. TaxID=3139201 RepID=UPI0030489BD6